MNKTFENIVAFRRSVRIFDPAASYDPNITTKCLRLAVLAPNSSNLQLWEFYKISNDAAKKKLAKYCMNQSAAKTANELVVFVVRKDLWRKRAMFNYIYLKEFFSKKNKLSQREKKVLLYYSKLIPFLFSDFLGIFGIVKFLLVSVIGLFRPVYRQVRYSDLRIVAHKSVALAAQTFMLAMASYGYDTCPMEGFDSLRVKKLLGLPRAAEINMIIACGIRKNEGIYTPRFRVPFGDVFKEWKNGETYL